MCLLFISSPSFLCVSFSLVSSPSFLCASFLLVPPPFYVPPFHYLSLLFMCLLFISSPSFLCSFFLLVSPPFYVLTMFSQFRQDEETPEGKIKLKYK